MAYEDLKNTILNNYGGQDNVPDSVYNALYKYKQNGQDALDDRDYAILSEAKTYKLPEVTEPSTMEFAAFAHPTTPEKAAKWAQENQEKDTYKVDQLAGRSAAGPNQEPTNPYQTGENPLEGFWNAAKDSYRAVRGGLTEVAAPVVGAWNTLTGPDAEWDMARYKEKEQEARNKAGQGEGVAGLISDPLNLSMLLPGLGEYVIGSKLAGPIIQKSPRLITAGLKGAAGAAEGGVLGAGSAALEDKNVSDAAKWGSIFGGGFGSVAGLGGIGDKLARAKLESEALRTFPGQTFANREAVKGAQELGSNFFNDADKLELLQEVSRLAKEKGIEPDYSAWYKLYQKLSGDVKAGYKTASDIAELHPRSEYPTYIPTQEVTDKMMERLGGKVGPFTTKDAEKFVNKKMGGWVERFGEDGDIPIYEMGMIKSGFNDDIFDQRAVIKNRENKVRMAKIAGEVLKDYMDKHKGFVTIDDALRIYEATQTGNLQRLGIDPAILGEKPLADIRPVSFNELVERTTPGTKKKFIQKERLEDVFEHQRVPTGSERSGKGLAGKLFEGATHTYKPSGNAYLDPVEFYRKSVSKYPTLYGAAGTVAEGLRRGRIGERLGKDIQ